MKFEISFSNGPTGEMFWLDDAVFDEIKVKDDPVDLASLQWLISPPAESTDVQ